MHAPQRMHLSERQNSSRASCSRAAVVDEDDVQLLPVARAVDVRGVRRDRLARSRCAPAAAGTRRDPRRAGSPSRCPSRRCAAARATCRGRRCPRWCRRRSRPSRRWRSSRRSARRRRRGTSRAGAARAASVSAAGSSSPAGVPRCSWNVSPTSSFLRWIAGMHDVARRLARAAARCARRGRCRRPRCRAPRDTG